MTNDFVPQSTELWAVRKVDHPRTEAMPRPWRPDVRRVIGWSTTGGTVCPVVWKDLDGAVVFTPVRDRENETKDWMGGPTLNPGDGGTEVYVALHRTKLDAERDAEAFLEDARVAYIDVQFQATTAGLSA